MKSSILILDATGPVGLGAVKATVEAGWPVVAMASDPQALEALRRRYPEARLQTVVGSVADEAAAAALITELRRFGQPFLGVIAALGVGDARGRLLDQSSELLRRSFDETVLPHLIAARHLLPWLAESGRNCGYVVIGGPGGRNPWAGYGHRSIAAAAIRMLARVLHGEAQAYAVRLQLLEVESPLRTDANEKYACQQWPCADHIGRKALALLRHRNDASCNDAIVDYRHCSGHDTAEDDAASDSDDVEAPPPRSSLTQDRGLTFPSGQASSSASADPPQEMDSDASLLPARCLQDVHKLLEHFSPRRSSPRKKNQERTK